MEPKIPDTQIAESPPVPVKLDLRTKLKAFVSRFNKYQKPLLSSVLLIGGLAAGLAAFNTYKNYQSGASSFAQFNNFNPNHINVGAIYWHCCVSAKRNEVEMLLSYDKWKDRQPYFTIDRGGGSVDIHEANQQVVDQEIQMAADAGLDYWAIFGRPGNEDGYSYGLNMYLNSPNKNRLKFALMLWTDLDAKDTEKFKQVIKDPQYLRVTPDARPVIFVWIPDSADFKTPQATFQNLINLTKQETGKTPVLVSASSNKSPAELKNWGFTDFGWYASAGSLTKGESYQALADRAVSTWTWAINTYLNIIPTAMVGWDPRPKALNPLYHGYGTDPAWTQQGTPEQIAGNVKSAIDWVNNHPAAATSKTVLIYAWNELAEGGWLMPTRAGNDQNQRLNAISKVLGGKASGVPLSPYTGNIPAPHPTGLVQITSPKNNSIVPAYTPFHVTGIAPVAVRLTLSMGSDKLFFINGNYEYTDNNSVSFDVTLPGLPTGIYTLTATGPDTTNVSVTNITSATSPAPSPSPIPTQTPGCTTGVDPSTQICTTAPGRNITSVSVSGSTITVGFTDNGVNKDWIGLYIPGSDNKTYYDWRWLNNQQGTAPATPPSSGSITFTNVKTGNYEVRYIIQDTGHAGVYTPGTKVTVQ